MKSILYKVAVLLLLAALLVSVFVFGWARYVEYASRRAFLAVAQHAREITAVEVLKITGASESGPGGSYRLPYDHQRYAITARHMLTGESAAKLVQTWEGVHFTQAYFVVCHNPGYVLRFQVGRRQIFETAVCFDCENVSYSPAPFEATLVQMTSKKFDPKSSIDELKAFLTQLP